MTKWEEAPEMNQQPTEGEYKAIIIDVFTGGGIQSDGSYKNKNNCFVFELIDGDYAGFQARKYLTYENAIDEKKNNKMLGIYKNFLSMLEIKEELIAGNNDIEDADAIFRYVQNKVYMITLKKGDKYLEIDPFSGVEYIGTKEINNEEKVPY